MKLPWNKEDNMIARARKLATKVHKGQHRWGGEPFIVHPKGVVENLREKVVNDPQTVIHNCTWSPASHTPIPLDEEGKRDYYVVGWLHDVVEDTATTLGDLLDMGFGYDIVQSVDAISKRDDEGYLEYVLRVKKNSVAREVKIADIEHNLSTFNQKKNKSRADKYKLAIEVLKAYTEGIDG